MTYGTGTYDFIPAERAQFSREAFSHTVSGAIALTLSMLAGGLILYAHSTATQYAPAEIAFSFADAPPAPAPTPARVVYGAAPAAAPRIVDKPPATPASAANHYIALLDPTYSLGDTPSLLGQSVPLRSEFQPLSSAPPMQVAEAEDVLPVPTPPMSEQFVQGVPLPAPRPADLQMPAGRAPAGRATAQAETSVVAPPADHRSFFEKLFGMSQSSGPALAYASAEDGSEEPKAGAVPYDRWTAVYDISTHTVYLPDGTRLEAHSGLGDALDDPRYVTERMRGPTPPGTYDLQPREQLFHGVQALRLIPVGNSDTYGRAGLLAHTYMLGQNGDSFGCVSFRDYKAFLRAYESGEVRRLTVVARLN